MHKSTVWLDNARIIAIIAVVMLHVTTIVMVSNEVGSSYWWFGNLYNALVRWCVPIFVMISGALLLNPQKQETLWIFYKKRMSRVLIPIISWSFFFLGWQFLKGNLKGEPPTVLELVKKLAAGNPYEHMWFLYMILGLYLFTPFLRKIIIHTTKQELNILIIATFTLSAINHTHTSLTGATSKLFINWFLLYIPFFLVGYRIRTAEFQPPKPILWAIFFISTSLTALGSSKLAITQNIALDPYFHGYLSLTVIPMSISIIYLLRDWNKPILNSKFTKQLSLLTLGIYLIHLINLEMMIKTGYATNFHPLISVPVVTGIVFSSSLLAAWILSQLPYLERSI